MKRVLTAVVLIPVVLMIVLRAPAALFAVVVLAVSLLACREFLQLAAHYGVEPFRKPTYIAIVILFAAIVVRGTQNPTLSTEALILAVFSAAVASPFAFLIVGMVRPQLSSAYPAASAAVFGVAYTGLPLLLLAAMRQLWAGAFLVLYLLLVVWVGDTAAYYVGRALGRHKLAPLISPGKTWEGGVASFVASVAVGMLIFSKARAISAALLNVGLIDRSQGWLAPSPPLLAVVLLSATINVAAQFGDLVESLLKRGAGVKDSGTLLPGHGGMLDRIDALLFAVPVLWYYAALRVIS